MGCAWQLIANNISNKAKSRLSCTSLGDSSGTPVANNCTANDVNVVATTANKSQFQSWSSARWIAYLADVNGMEKSGENPGNNTVAFDYTVAALVWSCGLERWYFASDNSLNAITPGKAHLADYESYMKTFAPLWLSYVYVGCEVDSTTSRALSLEVPDNLQLTNEKCRYYCAMRGYTLAGTEYTKQCFCGNSLLGNHGSAPSTDCKYACPGNTNERCGGDSRLSVYNAGTAGRLGCFFDDKSNRDLPFQAYSGSSNTPDKCRNLCLMNGYMYAGVQYGEECWCGNKYGSLGGALTSDCNMTCTGDSTIKCGAANRNMVFTSQIPGGYDIY